MAEPPTRDESGGSTGHGSWRDSLALQAARASAVAYALGAVVMAVTLTDWRRPVMVAAAVTCFVLASVAATSRWFGSRGRAWAVVAPGVFASLVGYGMVGFLSGPAVVLTVAIMFGGLLLGRRSMVVLIVGSVSGICTIAWAMIHGVIRVPAVYDLSMRLPIPWVRTTAITFFGIALMGSVLVGVVSRLERALEQSRLETQLREAADQARSQAEIAALTNRQLEAIGQLAAGVAHDFNNNLAAILGSAELLKEELGRSGTPAELVEDIIASSHRASQLTRQLLAYARKAPVVRVPTDLHQLIQATVTLVRRSIDPKVQVESRLNAESTTVLADPGLLENAMLNLLVNARDAMPAGGRLTIATSNCTIDESSSEHDLGLAPGAYILTEVIDTGTGIPADARSRIFEPFYTTKPVGKGTGLGLSAVVGTVNTHRGSITVESEPGIGTAFRILIPCDGVECSSTTREVAQLIKGSGRILLVDDDSMVRRTAVATLSSLGYHVAVAGDGVEALEVLRANPDGYDLVILDLQMPRMNGEATFGAMRELASEMPILVWSGHGGDVDVEGILRKGAAGFIQKPYRLVELSRAVHDAIERRGRDRGEGWVTA